MNDLTITQLFFILSLTDKGKLPSVNYQYISAYIVYTILLELQTKEAIIIDKYKHIELLNKDNDFEFSYLRVLYEYIKKINRKIKINDLIDKLTFTKTRDSVILCNEVGLSLERMQILHVTHQSKMNQNNISFYPDQSKKNDIVKEIIQSISEHKFSSQLELIAILLKKSAIYKRIFSQDEIKTFLTYTNKLINEYESSSITEITNHIDTMDLFYFLYLS